jgi:hypothetical protein
MSLRGHSTPVQYVQFGHTKLISAKIQTAAFKIWDVETSKTNWAQTYNTMHGLSVNNTIICLHPDHWHNNRDVEYSTEEQDFYL